MRALPFFLLLPFAALLALPAHTQGSTSEDLFREGVSLFARGEVTAACERFERSYRMDAAPGTLYNLATCHEKQGKLWQARLDYIDLIERATAAGKLDKAKLSRERLVAVELQLPKLALVFPPESNVGSVLVDNAVIAASAWHTPLPVDLGAHVIEFRAPGKATIKKTFTTGQAGPMNIDVPLLLSETAPSLSPPAPAPAPQSAPAPVSTGTSGPTPAPEPRSSSNTARLVVGYIVGGVGLAGLGVGTYFAFHAAAQKNDADAACGGQGGVCATGADTSAAQRLSSQSVTSEITSGVAFGLGVVAIGVSLVLIATGGSSRDPGHASTNVLLAPAIGQGFHGMSLTWRF